MEPHRPCAVLVVEDEALTREMVRLSLSDEGFDVTTADSVALMRTMLAANPVDVMLLDLSLPDGDALSVLRQEGGKLPPTICFSSHSDPSVRVAALEAGAVDFLVKPVDEQELAARLRRAARPQEAGTPLAAAVPVIEGWHLELERLRLVKDKEQIVTLTGAEARLLACFLENPGRPLARDWLTRSALRRSWQPGDRSVDVLVGRVRRKLDEQGINADTITTVRQVGYRYDPL